MSPSSSSRSPRGRVGDPKPKEEAPKPRRMVFGVDVPCKTCRGTGKRPGRKELCGACDGLGFIARETPDG